MLYYTGFLQETNPTMTITAIMVLPRGLFSFIPLLFCGVQIYYYFASRQNNCVIPTILLREG